jgi:hypothetical protein
VKLAISCLSCLILVMSLSACQTTPKPQPMTEEQRTNFLSIVLNNASAEINQTLPKMIDAETRLESTYAVGDHFYYQNTMLNYYVDNMDLDVFKQEMTFNTENFVCNNPALKFFLDNRVVMVYKYSDDDGRFIGDITVDTADCAEILERNAAIMNPETEGSDVDSAVEPDIKLDSNLDESGN